MCRPEDESAVVLDFSRLQPNGASPSHESEGMLAHYRSWALQRQLDRTCGERPEVVVLVSDEQEGSRGVATIAYQLLVVEFDVESLVDALGGERPGYNLFVS